MFISAKFIHLSPLGLQARTVSRLIKKAMSFKSNIAITYDGKKADAKSLINVLALKVPNGEIITVSASGDDEVLAVDELVKLVTLH